MDGKQQIQKAYESILDNDFEQAIEWFEQAVAREPENADYHYKISITYARSNKLNKALAHAHTASELAAGNEEYRFHLQNLQALEMARLAEQRLQHSSGQPDAAISLLKRAIALDPLCVDAHILLGIAYKHNGDYDLAAEAVKEALKLDPQHQTAKRLLDDYEYMQKQMLQQAKERN
ncbi:tetratricopeptide repeat protein [Ferviditalea candida]|uniref:Tetratricopeptide repeat protein n=1 Tax=Ferviditalea candida TaxID=3108399 RepID=A0ABU5ZFK7_9BACL|nr:tetratricopeptide repeat protein [Paenibacillaceae bacterium T2]